MTAASSSWTAPQVTALYEKPFFDLLFQAHTIHRQHFDPQELQLSALLSVKTGACPEDCAYCPQSGRFNTDLEKQNLLSIEEVLSAATAAKANGATRFCMGAAWRNPPERAFPQLLKMIAEVKKLGLETCVTLGMLTKEQAEKLKDGGLDYYNHNLDTSEKYYSQIITTRTYADRLTTLEHVRQSGMHVCCGGILGLGESREDRINFLMTLANFAEPPESVPINHLIKVAGTPLAENDNAHIDPFEFIRTIAVARIMLPRTFVRLSAGRTQMSDELQALCFFAGANSIFIGEKLLTSPNPLLNQDQALFQRLNLRAMAHV